MTGQGGWPEVYSNINRILTISGKCWLLPKCDKDEEELRFQHYNDLKHTINKGMAGKVQPDRSYNGFARKNW